jgi:hydroxymethylpyrimidine pyrophosphatase-like HAD family hydrolase
MSQPWRPKLVAVDADGTIADQTGDVPAAIAAQLRAIDAVQVPVVLVTGRSWLSAKLVLDQLGIPQRYCVCNNGGTVMVYPSAAVLAEYTFDPAPLVAAVARHPRAIIAAEDFGVGYRLSRPFPPGAYELHGRLTVVSLDELASQPVTRLILRDPTATADQFATWVASLDLSGLNHWLGGPGWLDVASAQAGKDKGLAEVARRLGVGRADVLAIGDSYNDINMVAWAGRGVALGDAPPELRLVADAVVPPFADGGTLDELARWFPADS